MNQNLIATLKLYQLYRILPKKNICAYLILFLLEDCLNMNKLIILIILLQLVKADLIEDIKRHEGYRQYTYLDSGHYSIGYGTNLKNGITKEEAEILLIYRLSIVKASLNQHKWFIQLDEVRQQVLLNMGYQLGIKGLFSFKHMMWRIKKGYYKSAANAMIESKWYKQSGDRAKELVYMMKNGYKK
jgi:lysozyme